MKFYVCDTETTGLDPIYHEIFEYSFIRVDDKLQIKRTIKAENPRNASIDALNITGKSIDDLYTGTPRHEACNDLINYINSDNCQSNERCLIGHNIAFDVKFLKAMLKKSNYNFPFDYTIDTMQMMRAYVKNNNLKTRKVNLDNSLSMLKIASIGVAHNAADDCKNTFFLYKKLTEEFDFLDYIKKI